MTDNAFHSAVDEFVSASPWLAPQHAPARATLYALARQLDAGDLTPALVGQFGLAYRNLAKLAPAEKPAADPLAEALATAQGVAQ